MSPTLEVRGSIPEIVKNKDGLYEGNLEYYLQVYFSEARNLCNGYHNFRHTCHILWLCHSACYFYRLEERMSKRDMRNLLIAAIFHDFNHTGVVGPDEKNISLALEALRKFILPEDEEYLEEITRILKGTEYPYKVPTEKMDLLVQIIREADTSQCLTVAWIQQVVFGFSTEWKKTPLEVLKMQEPFLSSLKFNTTWGKSMFPSSLVKEKIREVRELIDVLDPKKKIAA